jgi:hypothetical protein
VTTDCCYDRVVFLYNLYGPLFMYIKECVFDSAGMDGSPSIK